MMRAVYVYDWKVLQLILAFVNAFQMLAQIMGDAIKANTSEASGFFVVYSLRSIADVKELEFRALIIAITTTTA